MAMHKYFAVFLALLLVACKDSLPTHGRQIKPLSQHSSLHKDTVMWENNVPTPSSVIPKHGVASFEADTNSFRPTTPGNSPGVGHQKFASQDNRITKEMVAVQSTDDDKIFVTDEGTINGFKPTNPGHSPGVGHAQQNNIGSVIPKDGVASFEADTNGFKPTTPGNSPGVGHRKFASQDNKVMKEMVAVQRPDDAKVFVADEGTINGFRPTNPGHSLGVGHAQQNNIGFVIPKHGVASFEADTNGFRPTTPGNSPGVGHQKFASQDNKVMKEMVAVQSPDDPKVFVIDEETINDFKTTNPGHSPGVGHAQQNNIGHLN